jgi:hypothetical protein
MSWTVEEGAAAHDHVSPDLRPVCTRCGDLSTPVDKWCITCGTWLLLTAPLSSDLTARRSALLLAGEAVQPDKERGS